MNHWHRHHHIFGQRKTKVAQQEELRGEAEIESARHTDWIPVLHARSAYMVLTVIERSSPLNTILDQNVDDNT